MSAGAELQPGNTPSNQKSPRGAIRIFGVPVRLHFTFVLLFIFLLFFGVGGKQSGAGYALYIIGLFASVLLHELGHALVSAHYGIKTLDITMYPIGGISRLDPAKPPKPSEELPIALAGPVVNLLIAGVLFGVLAARHQLLSLSELTSPTDLNLTQRIAFGNLVLAVFNLLPAFPMDGGRILRAILARSRSEEAATAAAARSGQALAVIMGLYGLLTMNFMLVFIAFFVYLGAAGENAAATGRSLTHGVPVRAAMMTEFHTIPHGASMRDAAQLHLATLQQDFPVMSGGQVIGLLGRGALLRGLALEGQDAYVAGVMDREFQRIAPEMDLAEALPLMTTGKSCALVMSGDSLVGLLTPENISEFLLLRRFGLKTAPAGAA